jgi:hypothetical protein
MSDLKFNIEDLKFTEEADGVLVEVDEDTDTYKVIVALGKQLNPDSSEQEAFEAGLQKLIDASNE